MTTYQDKKEEVKKGCGISWTDEGVIIHCGQDYGKLYLCKSCQRVFDEIEQAREKTLEEVEEVLDNFKFSNIIRLNSNLGADSVQNMIKEQIMKALNLKTGGEE